MKKFNKKIIGFMIFLSIVGCSKQDDLDLFEYKMKKWTPSLPSIHCTAYPLYSDLLNPNDYLQTLYSEQGENIFYVGGLETYIRTLNDNIYGHSIRYDYIVMENMTTGEVSDTLWRPTVVH
tara:strand:- start:887 stop:1249 length:363 start_codon:yes stop_codon:yes gene_type:complete